MVHKAWPSWPCGHSSEVELYESSIAKRKAEMEELKKGPCPKCGKVGVEMLTAQAKAQAATAGPAPIETAEGTNSPRHYGTNKRAGRCRICGGLVAPGKGWLYRIDPDESYEHAGWVVEHKDRAACEHYAATKTIYH